MALTIPFTGGCACGAVRYEGSAEPVYGGFCCCRDCQHATGTGAYTVIGVPTASFRLTRGEPRYYESKAESGNTVQRAFCGECGSPLFGRPGGAPITGIAVGSLDDPSGFQPLAVIYTSRAHSWVPLPEGLPRFPKMPAPT